MGWVAESGSGSDVLVSGVGSGSATGLSGCSTCCSCGGAAISDSSGIEGSSLRIGSDGAGRVTEDNASGLGETAVNWTLVTCGDSAGAAGVVCSSLAVDLDNSAVATPAISMLEYPPAGGSILSCNSLWAA